MYYGHGDCPANFLFAFPHNGKAASKKGEKNQIIFVGQLYDNALQ